MSENFSSQFSPYISAFIAEKRGMGHKYTAEVGELKRFDEFVAQKGFDDPVITKQIFECWAEKRSYESQKTHHSRFRIIRQLCEYMVRIGLDSYVSPLQLKDNKSAFRPYIFTDDELRKFMECAYEMCGSDKRRLVFPMLFKILICTGVRLSEALLLEKEKVSFENENAILFIHGTKFNKDRLVPLTQELSQDFNRYFEKHELLFPNNRLVFPLGNGRAYAINAAYLAFRKILWQAGISHGGRGKGPRIHDFRHTFAVKSLRKMVMNEEDMLAVLPLLCKYLGHKNIHSTQVYLKFTAEMFPIITTKMESTFDIIPVIEVSK